MGIDNIDNFQPGQTILSADDLNAIKDFLKLVKRGISGQAPIKVTSSELGGIQISIDERNEEIDFVIDKGENVLEDGVIVPTFAGGTGLDSDGNILGEDPTTDYVGSRWTFINQGGVDDGGNEDTFTSVLDTSKPFIATVSETVTSGDYVGAKTGESLLQKDFPGFKVLADTSGLTGGTTALLVRRPVDGMLAKAQASIATDASGNVKLSETDGTTHGGNFSAFNIGSAVVSGDLIQLGEDAIGSVFFKPPGAIFCDCAEKDGSTDTYNQLSDYCDIINLHRTLPFSNELTFRVVTEDEAVQFVLEIDDEASFSTPIETTAPFFWDSNPKSINMVTLTGTMDAIKSGTHGAITVELVQTANPGSQVSKLGGVQRISLYMETLGTGFQLHIVDDGGGFRHIDFYKPDGTTLLWHTATYNSTGDKTVIDDGGQVVTGTITVDAVGSPSTAGRWDWIKVGDTNSEFVGFFINDLFQKTRERVWLRKLSNTDFQVEIYSGGCKIGQTALSKTTGAKTVSALTPSGWTCPALSGTITVDRWFHVDQQILISCPNGECCGTNNCSGGQPTELGCITVDWVNTSPSGSGRFCVDGHVELTDPRKCGDGSSAGSWDPASFSVTDPDTGFTYDFAGLAEATCCGNTITWTLDDKNGTDTVIEIVDDVGPIPTDFVISTVTYTVSIVKEVDCACVNTFPFNGGGGGP